MSEKRYVQHISGQGEKLEVSTIATCSEHSWPVCNTKAGMGWWFLPKSEYVLCDPPERWVEVTERIDPQFTFDRIHCEQADRKKVAVFAYPGYRLRKVQIRVNGISSGNIEQPNEWAFIVEKRETAP